MGTGYSGKYKNTYGSRLYEYELEHETVLLKEEITYGKKPTIDENALAAKDKFGFDEYGRIGKFDKKRQHGKEVNMSFPTEKPEEDSVELFEILGRGGDLEPLPNQKGSRIRLDDGTVISHRIITRTPDSPAVEISIRKTNHCTKVVAQKIHFERIKK